MNFFDDYNWHSSLEIGDGIKGKKIVRKLAASRSNLSQFIRIAKDSDYLVHKSTKELWAFDDDGMTIKPVFDDDVLTEDQMQNKKGE